MTQLLTLLIAGLCVLMQVRAASAEPIPYDFRIKRKVHIEFQSCSALNKLRVFVPFLATDCIGPIGRRDATEPAIHIDTVNATGRYLIDEFLRQDPRYAAVIDGDFVVIMSSQAAADPDYLLNLVIDHIAVKDMRLSEVAGVVAKELTLKTGREVGFVASANRHLFATLDLSSRTARNIMMEAAAQNLYSVQFDVEEDSFWYDEIGTAWDPYWETYSPEVEAVLKRRGTKRAR